MHKRVVLPAALQSRFLIMKSYLLRSFGASSIADFSSLALMFFGSRSPKTEMISSQFAVFNLSRASPEIRHWLWPLYF